MKRLLKYICRRCKGDTNNRDEDGNCHNCHEIVRLNKGGLTSVNVYGHEFGLIIPCDSGYLWEQQTEGVCCHHICIEGVYIPLYTPTLWNEKKKCRVNLLDQLTEANYNGKPTTHIWDLIDKELPFKYKEVAPPKMVIPYPPTQEGLTWIKMIGFDENHRGTIWRQFKDKTVALIYPNCD